MKTNAFLFLLLLSGAMMAAPAPKMLTVTVTNPLNEARTHEIVELTAPPHAVLVHDAQGQLLPSQRTYDGKLLFPATVSARGEATYTLTPAQIPYTYTTLACGRVYPERADDVAWENDLVAFRAYGPALQKRGERAYGHDIWCKRATPHPVVEQRYFNELKRGITYHRDHGNGLDCYKVGPTLGAGAPALLHEGALAYPWAYETCQILDNGPLRFTVRLTYPKRTLGETSDIIETRLISLDAHTHFNKTTVSYSGLTAPTPMAVGIVQHIGSKQSLIRPELLLCDDPTERPKDNAETGTLFVGALFPTPATSATFLPLSQKARKATAAEGHLIATTTAPNATPYTYYWGSGWSRSDIPTWEAWTQCAQATLRRLQNPLQITIQ